MRVFPARFSRTKTAIAVAIPTVLLLAACGSTAAPEVNSAEVNSAEVNTSAAAPATSLAAESGFEAAPMADGMVTVMITADAGCVASPDTVAAGAITFNVSNLDAVGVTEVELLSDERIRGERENLAPGFDTTFSVNLDGGSYEIYCPGATNERTPFTVTGDAAPVSTDLAELLQRATVDYADYIDVQTGLLVDALPALVDAVKGGDLAAAKLAYADSRRFYERIEPVAESFGDLDPAMDLRVGDVEAGTEWTGFHPIEKALFQDKTTEGLSDLADKLLADAKDLQARSIELGNNTRENTGSADRYKPDEVANGAVALLGEVQASKITGEEEAYSRIDLLDFEANVEGSQQAFLALKPALNEIDAALVTEIEGKFVTLIAALNVHADPASLGGFTPYNDLTDADIKTLADQLFIVIEPLSTISSKIATA